MKNKWNLWIILILAGLMLFNNKNSFSQIVVNNDDSLVWGWTNRTYYDDLYCHNCWLDDTKDLFYSAKYDKERDSILESRGKVKYSDVKINSIIKLATNTKDSSQNREHALMQLGYIESKRQIPYLENMLLTDKLEFVRSCCVKDLINLNSVSSIPLLIKVLNTNIYIQDKINIALFLAENGEKTISFNTLKSIWCSGEGLKHRCHDGFIYINTPESIEMLRLAMNSINLGVSLDASAAMAQLGYKEEAFTKIKELLDDKVKDTSDFYFKNVYKEIKFSAMKILAYYISDQKSFELIKQMQQDKDAEIVKYSQRVLKKYKNIIKF